MKAMVLKTSTVVAALAVSGCILSMPAVRAFVPLSPSSPTTTVLQSGRVRKEIPSLLSVRNCDDDLEIMSSGEKISGMSVTSRRSLLSSSSSAVLSMIALSTVVAYPDAALAGIDPSALKSLRVEGDASGAATRLKQIEAAKSGGMATDVDKPWEDLPSGVLFREYKEGRGDAVVEPGSKVGVEMTIRCKSFATANEPGGVKYFSTKDDTEFNELAFTVGSGEVPPGLEEGMMGMRRGGIRRVELPSTMVFAARNAGQLPLPSEKNKDGKRRFENLFKTDATLLFEVLVTRVK
mmetsp:Transcript_48841/g.90595  ORF Transcript_48841/g.90595 Transcript_48841/m.90595 type:complete len:293 (-) Transcript_48841:362-1240(-)